jgi:hypothetical protein
LGVCHADPIKSAAIPRHRQRRRRACPADRDPFIAAVAAELAGHQPIGDGTIGRAIREVQGRFARPEPPERPSRWDCRRPNFEHSSRRAY